MTEDDAVVVDAGVLERFVAELFGITGLDADDANFCAGCMVRANLWGVDSHGVLRLPTYIRRLTSRIVNPTPRINVIRRSDALEVMDGDDGLGFIVGRAAMIRAIQLAEQHGLGMVSAINSSHFGAAGIYARMAVERGMIGVAMSNSVPKVVAPGGRRPVAGSNALAIAVPSHGEFPFVLDMSLAAVAGGKLLLAAARNEKIPLNWATDSAGTPTDDPQAAFAGFYLPMGGVKGLGLAYVVDILSGLITGGRFGLEVGSMYASNEPSKTAHAMIVINPEGVISRKEMTKRMSAFFNMIKSSPTNNSDIEMLIPGEIEYRTAHYRASAGIPLPPQLFDELRLLGEELGAANRLERISSTTHI